MSDTTVDTGLVFGAGRSGSDAEQVNRYTRRLVAHYAAAGPTGQAPLLRVVAMGNAHMSGQDPAHAVSRGLVYVARGSAPANPLLALAAGELAGTVSAYSLGRRSDDWTASAAERLRQIGRQTRDGSGPIYDTSFEEGAAAARAAATSGAQPSFAAVQVATGTVADLHYLDALGQHNTGISLVTSDGFTAHDDDEEFSERAAAGPRRWLVVRTHFAGALPVVGPSDRTTTLAEVAASPRYRALERLSQQNADRLAFLVVSELGLEPEFVQERQYVESFSADLEKTMLQPDIVNRYNTVRAEPNLAARYGTTDVVQFHHRAYDTEHADTRGGLLLGTGRASGYLLLRPLSRHLCTNANGEARMRIAHPDTASGYPMGYQRRGQRSAASAKMLQEPNATAKLARLSFGSGHLDVKALPALNYAKLYDNDQWGAIMHRSGMPMNTSVQFFKLAAAYLSSPNMTGQVALQELLDFHVDPASGKVDVPLDHKFVTDHMWKAVVAAVRTDPAYRFTDLQLEHKRTGYVSISAAGLRHLHAVTRSYAATAATAAAATRTPKQETPA